VSFLWGTATEGSLYSLRQRTTRTQSWNEVNYHLECVGNRSMSRRGMPLGTWMTALTDLSCAFVVIGRICCRPFRKERTTFGILAGKGAYLCLVGELGIGAFCSS